MLPTHTEDEHGTLRGQIEQLKTSLEHAQMVRRRKIEYDLVAEKVNTLPSREELERSVVQSKILRTQASLTCRTIEFMEDDMAAIRAEHDNQNRTIQGQKAALDGIISDLGSLRFMGKDRDMTASSGPSPRDTPAPDGNGEVVQDAVEMTEAVEVTEEKEDGEEDRVVETLLPAEAAEDDIEMGEVEEPRSKGKKKREEELEEGEASDASSALSDPPDD